MPNWVCAAFSVTGDREELGRFNRSMIKPLADATDGSLTLDFNGIIPMPAHGRFDPEAWAIHNWGTKWNAQSVVVDASDPDLIRLHFITPWEFPEPVFEALAKEYPRLVFEGSAYEESGEYELVGQFGGGGTWGPGELRWV